MIINENGIPIISNYNKIDEWIHIPVCENHKKINSISFPYDYLDNSTALEFLNKNNDTNCGIKECLDEGMYILHAPEEDENDCFILKGK